MYIFVVPDINSAIIISGKFRSSSSMIKIWDSCSEKIFWMSTENTRKQAKFQQNLLLFLVTREYTGNGFKLIVTQEQITTSIQC